MQAFDDSLTLLVLSILLVKEVPDWFKIEVLASRDNHLKAIKLCLERSRGGGSFVDPLWERILESRLEGFETSVLKIGRQFS